MYIINLTHVNKTSFKSTRKHNFNLTGFNDVTGPPGMPGNVYRIKGSETTRSVTIKWTEPPDHGSQIQQYNIEARTMDNPKWRQVATSSLSHYYSISVVY